MLGLGLVCPMQAQTYSLTPEVAKKPPAKPQPKSKAKAPKAQPGTTPAKPVQIPLDQKLGWGSNIQDARLARAAELALQRGDRNQAVDYAQRAAQATPNDPHLWFLFGYAARLDGRSQLAVDAYNHGLRLSPGSLEGLSGLAQTYGIMGRADDAEKLLKQVLASDPRRVDDSLLLGELYMRSGDYPGALDYFRRAEQVEPGVRSELLIALSYQHMKNLEQADRYLEMAKHRAPDNPEVERSLAGYYLEMGSYPDAIASLKSIRNPRPDVVAELAYTYQLSGNTLEAARVYAQAANSVPGNLALQLSAAQAAVTAGAIDQADPFLKRAAGLEADDYRLHAIRGEIARIQERDADAVQEYTAAVAHLPPSPAEGPLYGIQLHMDLMELDRSLKNPDAAQEQLAIAQKQIGALDERGPDRVPFLRLRAMIEMNAGQLDNAGNDLNEALTINPKDANTLQMDGDLLMKQGHTEDAIVSYKKVLAMDATNRFALTSLGYASRAAGRDQEAEKYFQALAKSYPRLYVPYLALGDLYTARRDYPRAEAAYSKANELAPKNALVVAGGMNAAIEAKNLDLAGTWLGRATGDMLHEPLVLREKERYLSFRGEYQQSAEAGREVITMLPKDRDVVVYLGYDLLDLGEYDELLKLTTEYGPSFPKEPDIPLLSGYVHKHNGQLAEARKDFSDALDRDPNVVTAYINRGYVLHDLHLPRESAADFESALKREPNNGEAHLGLAYASLDMHRPQIALKQAQLAEQVLGDSQAIHLIRATAYGQRGNLTKAADEYRAALKYTPNDGSLHLALAGVLYSERRYHDAVDELQIAEKLSPDNGAIYALLARAYAQQGDRDKTLQNVTLAEQKADQTPVKANDSSSGASGIYLSTGSALSVIGDQKGAMDRFGKALTLPGSDRVGVRLAIALVMSQQDHDEDARRQIALAQMEAATGETLPFTGEQWISAADVLRGLHDYQLAEADLERARAVGAPESAVRIGFANNYLAIGDTVRAQGELAAISHDADSEPDYQYLLAQANVLRQEHQGPQALTAFAQASDAAGEDQTAQESLLQAGADEGFRVDPRLSLLSNFSVDPIFEDTTVYVLDSKLDATMPVSNTQASLLPPPRSSMQSQWTMAYHLHLNSLPTASGFFQVRNARGQISVPATNSIVNRDTNDYSFNFGLNPTVHLGTNVLTFNSGIQATVRRDSDSPFALNQNLFRVFTYMSTSSFFNVISVSGFGIRESGPFTESNLHSRTYAGGLDFRVGAPWGKTALVTGWGASDQLYTPITTENYFTSSYIGLEHRFTERWNARAVFEDLRAWRTVGANSGIAQAVRPAGTVNFSPTRNWNIRATSAYSSTRAFHVYDAIQSGASVSYAVPFHHGYREEGGEVPLQYPIRFAAGIQQESFFNFTDGHSEQFRPYVSISIF